MPSSPVGAEPRTRRESLARASVLGASATLASLGLSAGSAPAASPASEESARGDSVALDPALTLERAVLALYEKTLASPTLDARLAGTARVFADHARRRVATLLAVLEAPAEESSGAPSPPRRPRVAPQPPSDVSVDALPPGRLPFLRRAIELETRGIAAYLAALPGLYDARLLQESASAMASKGQHLVVLRKYAGLDPVPAAFVTGGRETPFVNRSAQAAE